MGLPWWSVGKNRPANAGDMGLLSGPGTWHVLLSSEACVPQLLTLCSGAQQAATVEPVRHKYCISYPGACALQHEKPLQLKKAC